MNNHSNQNPFEILDQLNQVGISLSAENKLEKLLSLILESAVEIIHADGGTLYLATDHDTLKFSIIQNKSLGIKLGGDTGNEIKFPEIPLHKDGHENINAIASFCALTKKTVNIENAYLAEGFDFSGAKAFDEKNNYRTQSVLAIPLINHENKVLGVLQLINCLDSNNKVVLFNEFSQKVAESLASQAAISLNNRLLITQLENLFEGITNLINTAIDEKSPYTGGHCLRVPELTLMIADAVDQEKTGPFAEFHLKESDRYELKVAAMLHDCGKITTPVHVVDKGTKLETIFDRIHLIETKAEILRKEIQRDALEKILANPEKKQEYLNEEVKHTKELDSDIEFIKHCNIGGERMKPEDIDRVREISKKNWTDANNDRQPFLTEDEIYNLTIVAGTLTKEEREIINYHIESTIKLLEQINWPDHLKHVPEFAGGHHERMDGKGYPKGLTKAQMSIQARIMGIADIFEALTASDRPYKKGMKLSQCLSIMDRMKDEGHIDPDLYDVFKNQRLYLRYAQQFLKPEQIDIQ